MEQKTIRIEAEPTREDANRIISERRDTVRAYVLEKLREFDMPQPVCDLRFGLWLFHSEHPYGEIINAANHMHSAMMCAWYFFFEAERLRRELAELKGREVENVKCMVVE